MAEPSIDYETDEPLDRVRARVKGGNGEQVFATEWYDSQSNAERGLSDIARIVLWLVAYGHIEMNTMPAGPPTPAPPDGE